MKRLGRRKRPFYRLVAIDSKTRREGAEVERLGWYDPLNKDNHFSVNEDRIKHWLGVGAKASHAAKGLLKKAGLSYKWHLEKNGASEEEVVRLLEEWQNNKSLKAEKSKEISVIEEPVEEETEDTVVATESGDEESQEEVETLEETASKAVGDSPKEEPKEDSSEEKSEEKLEAAETAKEESE
jgi:small subunit ribosomal protein S16